jgi:hypothetical protein
MCWLARAEPSKRQGTLDISRAYRSKYRVRFAEYSLGEGQARNDTGVLSPPFRFSRPGLAGRLGPTVVLPARTFLALGLAVVLVLGLAGVCGRTGRQGVGRRPADHNIVDCTWLTTGLDRLQDPA